MNMSSRAYWHLVSTHQIFSYMQYALAWWQCLSALSLDSLSDASFWSTISQSPRQVPDIPRRSLMISGLTIMQLSPLYYFTYYMASLISKGYSKIIGRWHRVLQSEEERRLAAGVYCCWTLASSECNHNKKGLDIDWWSCVYYFC